MAEIGIALLTVLFDNIFNKLRSVFGNEFRLLQGGVAKDLHNLEATVKNFQHVLRDGEVKEFKSTTTKDWFRRLKYIANEADGILDDAMDSDSDSDDDNQTRVCHPFPPCIDFNRVANRHNLGERIRSVTQKFALLDSEKSTLDFGEIVMNRETTSTSSEPKVFGRNEAKEEIIKALLNGADIQTGGPPFVYAIVGLGGIGKTTLAQLIYNDEKVVEKFDARLWVWISQTFDVKIVMRKLIEAHSNTPCQFESLETMQNQLKVLLNGKKFFIVLDDIWISNEDLGEWNKIKSALKCGANGSSVILTTRQSDVASLAGSHDRHYISLLSDDESWFLFKESSFLEGNQENGKLEVIGKQIVRKCGGLPLAVKNLGGSLRSTRVVAEWESVRDSEIWELERSCEILPALKLSLFRLESHSRDCFTFSSIFPKGYEMSKAELIHLWMANDLVPSRRLELEDMGNKILNELVLKSFFQISSYVSVTMHDLMHDLARSYRDECFCLEGTDVSTVPPHILQLSIDYQYSLTPNILETLSKSHPSLRTCIYLNKYLYPSEKIIFKNLDCLRALCMTYIQIDNLPLSIGKSKHLKYLDLTETCLTHLPDTICTLTKLQTLILHRCLSLTHLPDGIEQLINLRHLQLSGCEDLTHLPVGISQMTNLRHLSIHGCDKLTQLPSGMGKLVYLRTLGQFIVGRESGQRITELQGLNHLGGFLEISGLQHVRDASEAREAVLKEKKNMYSLSLIWGDLQGSNSTSDEAEGVLEALEPPQSLDGTMVIAGYGGSVFASWIKLLENLVEVELRDCFKCERLPPLGQLPLLKYLYIIGMKSLKCIGTDFYGGDDCTGSSSGSERSKIFPSLEKLDFEDMPMLEEWDTPEITDKHQTYLCPRLKKFVLSECPNLTLPPLILSLSCLTSLELVGDNTKSFPYELLQNLEDLEISESELTSLPKELSNLASLRTLKIEMCPALQSLSPGLQDLSTLECLTVSYCYQLEFSIDDFQNLISLQMVRIVSLPRVTSFSFPNLQYLSNLQSLDISDCNNLRLWPQGMQNLRVLRSLIVNYCKQLELSTGDFQHLVNLQWLALIGLNKLTSLPEDFQHLRSLQELKIENCRNLTTLPPGLQNLTSLQLLLIEGCHRDLHLRCEKDKGEYWPLISHIQRIIIRERY